LVSTVEYNLGDVMSRVQKIAAPPSSAAEDNGSSANSGEAERIRITVNGVRIPVSPELKRAVLRAQEGILQPPPSEMTTTQAAAFLDVSRPFIIKLTKSGALPCRRVGQHRRIPSEAVLQYRETMFEQAQKAADEIAQWSQDAGLYETELPRKAQ
jgi:excisionase family DNA binding protein